MKKAANKGGLLFNLEDGGDMFLRTDYATFFPEDRNFP
jgi:hypothetical protein